MNPSIGVSRLLLQILALFAFISVTLAATMLDELLSIFDVEMREVTGGTYNRGSDLKVPTPILPKVLAAFEDAWVWAAFGLDTPSVRMSGSAQDPPIPSFDSEGYSFYGLVLRSQPRAHLDQPESTMRMLLLVGAVGAFLINSSKSQYMLTRHKIAQMSLPAPMP